MLIPRFIRRLFREPYDGLRRLHVVDPGRLLRCGQPRPEQVESLIAQYGLRTVISLRGSRRADDPDEWETLERAACARGGARFHILPFNHRNPPTAAQAREFLALASDPGQTPALVHCRLGQQRTGLMVGLYRVHVQGATPSAALAEMDALGFNSRHRRHQRLLSAFHALCDPANLNGG